LTRSPKKKGEKLSSLWVGQTDLLTGNEVDFNTLPNSVLDTCQNALDECWEWNSENNYLESQQLRLYPYNLGGLHKTNDHLYYKEMPLFLKGVWKELHQGMFLTSVSLNIPTLTDKNISNLPDIT
jgi:hypothetical protein